MYMRAMAAAFEQCQVINIQLLRVYQTPTLSPLFRSTS